MRLGRVFPVEESHRAQAPLKRLVPHHGGVPMQMRFIFPWFRGPRNGSRSGS